MVYDHANPFSIHDFETADLLKASITLLEGLEYLISIAGALPAALLVQKARMLQEIDAPVQKCLPFSLFQGDAILVQHTLGLHELLRILLLVDLVFPLDLNLWIEQLNDVGSIPSLQLRGKLEDPVTS